MTNPNHDGWPAEYSDPRDRPHPDVLRVTVESFDEMCEDTITAIDTAASGDEQPAVVSFATVGELRKILTDCRLEVLQTLIDTDSAAESISALAQALDRDYRAVHDDVTLLADYGLLFIVDDDNHSRHPYIPYERIQLHVELTATDPSEVSTAM